MASLAGITELHMSGARAVFQVEKGATLKEEEIADAFAEQGMKLESFERVERPRAAVRYEVDAGVT
jgi:hypothetical protein